MCLDWCLGVLDPGKGSVNKYLMGTPIGHSLVAGLFYLTGNKNHSMSAIDWPLLLVYILFANGPDLDFLPGLVVGDPGRFHHGITHSFGFGLIFTFVVAGVLTRVWKPLAEFGFPKLLLVGFILYSSHIALDLITLDDSVPYGMPLLWPFSGQYLQAPVYILPNVLRGGSELGPHNLKIVLREIVVFAPPILYLMLANRRFLTPAKRLLGLGLVAYMGVVLALLTSLNPFFGQGR